MRSDVARRETPTVRIENNPGLLSEMMADLATCDSVLGPGPYWLDNQATTVDWLRNNDLNGFRAYADDGKALSNFGGGSRWRRFADIEAELQVLDRSLIYRAATRFGISAITRRYIRAIRARASELLTQRMIAALLARLVAERDTDAELAHLAMAPIGDPSDAIEINGRLYTPKFLDEFLKYLDMKREIDFTQARTMVEIGPGAGNFAELMAKLDPTRRLYLIDIPPQLYVLEKVLSAAFPGEVLGYAESKRNPARLEDRDWRIAILAPWQADDLTPETPDFAFNQVSFSEMRRETAVAYLGLLDRWGTRHICFRAADKAKTPEGPGATDYIEALSNYALKARIPIAGTATGVPASAPTQDSQRTSSAFYFERNATSAA